MYRIRIRSYGQRFPHEWALSDVFDIYLAQRLADLMRQSCGGGGLSSVGADVWLVPA